MAVNTPKTPHSRESGPVNVPDPAANFDTARAMRSIRDRWWLLVLAPIVALSVATILMRYEPYQTTVNATVLLPGDTEDPGNSERPELMMLDDLPSLVRSWVFAEAIHAGMGPTDATVADVQGALDGHRYSRILTVSISDGSAERVSEIADSVEAQLPRIVNEYLVPAEGEQATVRIIDPPGVPERKRENDVLQLFLVGVTALIAGSIVAIAAGPRNSPSLTRPDGH